MGGIMGGGSKRAAPPPKPVEPPAPTGVTRAEQLAASRRRSRGGRDSRRSLLSADRLGPGPGDYETRDQLKERLGG